MFFKNYILLHQQQIQLTIKPNNYLTRVEKGRVREIKTVALRKIQHRGVIIILIIFSKKTNGVVFFLINTKKINCF